MDRLLQIMRRLRGPGGCPWDQEQTHLSLRRYLLEEAAEAVDAIEGDDSAHLAEELGDVLLQVAFHAVIAEESGGFGYQDVETAVVDKLVRRHPHVFGEAEAVDSAQVLRNWEAIKAEERGDAPARPHRPPLEVALATWTRMALEAGLDPEAMLRAELAAAGRSPTIGAG